MKRRRHTPEQIVRSCGRPTGCSPTAKTCPRSPSTWRSRRRLITVGGPGEDRSGCWWPGDHSREPWSIATPIGGVPSASRLWAAPGGGITQTGQPQGKPPAASGAGRSTNGVPAGGDGAALGQQP
jgi:hypothetical protein